MRNNIYFKPTALEFLYLSALRGTMFMYIIFSTNISLSLLHFTHTLNTYLYFRCSRVGK